MNTTLQPFITNDTDLGPKADKQLRISILSLILLFSTISALLVTVLVVIAVVDGEQRPAPLRATRPVGRALGAAPAVRSLPLLAEYGANCLHSACDLRLSAVKTAAPRELLPHAAI